MVILMGVSHRYRCLVFLFLSTMSVISCTTQVVRTPKPGDPIPPEVANIEKLPRVAGQVDDATISSDKNPIDLDRLVHVKAHCPYSCVYFYLDAVDKNNNYAVKKNARFYPIFNKYDRVFCRAIPKNDPYVCTAPGQESRLCHWSYIPRGIAPGYYLATFVYDRRDDSDMNCQSGQQIDGGRVGARQIIQILP